MRRQHGFSVIELLIASGLLSLALAALMTLVTNSAASQRATNVRLGVSAQTMAISGLLMNETACFRTFGGLALATGSSVNQIKTATGQPFINVMTKDSDPMGPRSMRLTANPVDPLNLATLTLTYEITGQITPKPYVLDITVELVGGVVQKCSSYGLAQAKLALSKIKCPTNRVLQGFDASGAPVCVTMPSQCNGTQPRDTQLSVTSDAKQQFMGRLCGQQTGKAKTCTSCIAQWMYNAPFDGNAYCRCI